MKYKICLVYCVFVHTKLDWVVTIVFVFRLNGNRVQLSCARHMRACVRLAWQGIVKTRSHTSYLVLSEARRNKKPFFSTAGALVVVTV